MYFQCFGNVSLGWGGKAAWASYTVNTLRLDPQVQTKLDIFEYFEQWTYSKNIPLLLLGVGWGCVSQIFLLKENLAK
jgi:hypothetical protein